MKASVPRPVRCAIYTRKSTEEGLDQAFNSLDAQREAGVAFIASQKSEGWVCLPSRYDDGGYTGGNMERPGLAKLLTDIRAGLVDCVAVYKVDRLSRSLLDFARMMETFDKHSVSFVSVTQQFNTTHSMGRLTLNILLSFAQFEREIISERTRDKIAATRRKGKWCGGRPILGYDIDTTARRMVINETEAAQVREIFDLYRQHSALLRVVGELERRRWTNKRWISRKGEALGGLSFTKTSLYKLLCNPLYAGRIRYKDETYPGEHEAIIAPEIWQEVNDRLRSNGRAGGSEVRNLYGALLKRLLVCKACGCAMTHTTTRRGMRVFRYYVCTSAQKRGWKSCPTKSLSAEQIEAFVVSQIRAVGRDPAVLMATLEAAGGALSRNDLQGALFQFDDVWQQLSSKEQARMVHLLLEQVVYDRAAGQVAITFRPTGIRTLGGEKWTA